MDANHDSYRAVAWYYDYLIEPLNRKLKRVALRYAQPTSGDSVLDVGCGTGTLLELYLEAGCQVTGIDASAAMLEVARRRLGERAELCLGDAGALPFGDQSFDWVVATMMLHELDPKVRTAVLAEAKRVLRPSGRVLVVDYHDGPVRPLQGWLLKAMITTIERLAGGDHWAGYRHFVRHGAARQAAAAVGLEVDRERVVADGNLAITVLRAAEPG